MANPKPFSLYVPAEDLDLLAQKLTITRLPDEPTGYTLEQGVPLSTLTRLLTHWRTAFLPSWRAHEAALNELPMFTLPVATTDFGTLDVHFVHARSDVAGAIPLLFLHGWPGSFLEVQKLLPLLTGAGRDEGEGEGEGEGPAFHVVAPSLPNYGFSEGLKERGFNLRHYAETAHNLMQALGYTSYTAQGGDWGSIIARYMGRQYPAHLRAVHVNMAFFSPGALLTSPLTLLRALVTLPFWPAHAWRGLRNALDYQRSGMAYFALQRTRPQTVAAALADSPAALLAWLAEKLLHWTDGYAWADDEILMWVSIYWFSRAGPGASVRTYFESAGEDPAWHGRKGDADLWTPMPRSVLLGVTQFPRDLVGIPGVLAGLLGNCVFERWADDGGHFAAWERPEVLAADLRRMFGRGGPAFGCVEGNDGYGEAKKDL